LDDADGTRCWLALGSNRGWTRGACRTSGSHSAGRTDCSHVTFVPFVALLTLRPNRGWTGGACRTSGSHSAGRTDCSHVTFVALLTWRTLWPLSASLTLSSRNPLHTLGALRTGRALGARIALRPRILAARCQRKRNADDEQRNKLHANPQQFFAPRRTANNSSNRFRFQLSRRTEINRQPAEGHPERIEADRLECGSVVSDQELVSQSKKPRKVAPYRSGLKGNAEALIAWEELGLGWKMIDPKAKLLAVLDTAERYRGLAIEHVPIICTRNHGMAEVVGGLAGAQSWNE
jgi:hypothetical protein